MSNGFQTAKTKLDEAKILLAGDHERAKELCREFCKRGFCVSVKPIQIIWTGGEEPGVEIYFFEYPRSVQRNIREQGLFLLDFLIHGLGQQTGTLLHGSETITHFR